MYLYLYSYWYLYSYECIYKSRECLKRKEKEEKFPCVFFRVFFFLFFASMFWCFWAHGVRYLNSNIACAWAPSTLEIPQSIISPSTAPIRPISRHSVWFSSINECWPVSSRLSALDSSHCFLGFWVSEISRLYGMPMWTLRLGAIRGIILIRSMLWALDQATFSRMSIRFDAGCN